MSSRDIKPGGGHERTNVPDSSSSDSDEDYLVNEESTSVDREQQTECDITYIATSGDALAAEHARTGAIVQHVRPLPTGDQRPTGRRMFGNASVTNIISYGTNINMKLIWVPDEIPLRSNNRYVTGGELKVGNLVRKYRSDYGKPGDDAGSNLRDDAYMPGDLTTGEGYCNAVVRDRVTTAPYVYARGGTKHRWRNAYFKQGGRKIPRGPKDPPRMVDFLNGKLSPRLDLEKMFARGWSTVRPFSQEINKRNRQAKSNKQPESNQRLASTTRLEQSAKLQPLTGTGAGKVKAHPERVRQLHETLKSPTVGLVKDKAIFTRNTFQLTGARGNSVRPTTSLPMCLGTFPSTRYYGRYDHVAVTSRVYLLPRKPVLTQTRHYLRDATFLDGVWGTLVSEQLLKRYCSVYCRYRDRSLLLKGLRAASWLILAGSSIAEELVQFIVGAGGVHPSDYSCFRSLCNCVEGLLRTTTVVETK